MNVAPGFTKPIAGSFRQKNRCPFRLCFLFLCAFFFFNLVWCFLKSYLGISDRVCEMNRRKKKKHMQPLCSHFKDPYVLNSSSVFSESFRKPRRTSVQYSLGQEQALYLLFAFFNFCSCCPSVSVLTPLCWFCRGEQGGEQLAAVEMCWERGWRHRCFICSIFGLGCCLFIKLHFRLDSWIRSNQTPEIL